MREIREPVSGSVATAPAHFQGSGAGSAVIACGPGGRGGATAAGRPGGAGGGALDDVGAPNAATRGPDSAKAGCDRDDGAPPPPGCCP